MCNYSLLDLTNMYMYFVSSCPILLPPLASVFTGYPQMPHSMAPPPSRPSPTFPPLPKLPSQCINYRKPQSLFTDNASTLLCMLFVVSIAPDFWCTIAYFEMDTQVCVHVHEYNYEPAGAERSGKLSLFPPSPLPPPSLLPSPRWEKSSRFPPAYPRSRWMAMWTRQGGTDFVSVGCPTSTGLRLATEPDCTLGKVREGVMIFIGANSDCGYW